ncbi:MAG: thiamine pyrophosphate-binding protein [Oscillospiraceae bacterium]|nr:thiamine pyrophosphate-binding protein [Oscillospiraceae bacterium]
MTKKFYTIERGHQILISLLKQSNIKKVVASPGATNVTLIGSLQNDPFFEIYSCVDERSAAYLAVGLSEESGEPVVLSCTGATASRNYVPGLTEAFYRKLPILAVTATQNENRIGHLIPQMMDRTQQMKDLVVLSEHIQVPRNDDDEWDATIRLNRAILALSHRGGGPVHINLATNYSLDYSVKDLPVAKKIFRHTHTDNLPDLPSGRIGIMVGNHKVWSTELITSVEKFCESYGAVVFCEHGSNYGGKYCINSSILTQQECCKKDCLRTNVLIHIGEVGAYGCSSVGDGANAIWRLSEDGELRDPYKKLVRVFEMSEEEFFTLYSKKVQENRCSECESWLKECESVYEELQSNIPVSLPFSNPWIAQQTAHRLPENSVLHLGILNSHRSWTMFHLHPSINANCFVNTGGFGIDGCMSSMIGGSLAQPNKLHFLVIGDLAFFYDLNSLGIRHIGKNIRILLVNNGKGTEFRNFNHPAARFGDSADEYMAAARHNGNKSSDLVKHFVEDLGFDYYSATNKDEYLTVVGNFVSAENHTKPLLLEVFTNSSDESDAIEIMSHLKKEAIPTLKNEVRSLIPESVVTLAKKILR